MENENKKYDYEGYHATGDILLNEYPENMIDIVRECIKYSNLNIVSEHIKQFTPEAATALFVLSESHFSCHEYPESNYVTVDCYTCGKEGDPLAAINNLVKVLDDLVGVKDKDIKFLKRGEFNKTKAFVENYDFINTKKETYEKMQKKLDEISKSLTEEQIKELQEILDFTAFSNYS